MLSPNNKMINVKVSKEVYDFIDTFAKKYHVSVTSFCQDCVTKRILELDKEAAASGNADLFYSKLSTFINASYDARRK